MSDQPTSSADATVTTEPAGRWEDFVDLFYAPASVFARRANSSFWIPMIVTSVLLAATLLLTFNMLSPAFEAEVSRAMAVAAKSNPALTPDAIAQATGLQMKIAKYSSGVFVPIIITIVALALWLSGKIVGAKQSWNAALVVASYAYFPKALEPIVNGVIAMMSNPATLTGRYRVGLGLGRFLDPETASPLLLAVLGRLDVFTLGVTVLIAVGVSVTGRVSRAEGAMVGVIVWLVGAIPTVLPTLMK